MTISRLLKMEASTSNIGFGFKYLVFVISLSCCMVSGIHEGKPTLLFDIKYHICTRLN